MLTIGGDDTADEGVAHNIGLGEAGDAHAFHIFEDGKRLIEAGGDLDGPSVSDPSLWPTNLGSERDWGFETLPNPHLNGRSITLSMGKAVGGGSAIDAVTVWDISAVMASAWVDDWDPEQDAATNLHATLGEVLDPAPPAPSWRVG